MMEYFELDKRKNFDERKYLSTELLDKLGLNKYRKLIEENDAIYCSGKYGYKLKNETYEKIKENLCEMYKDAYDLEDEEEKEMFNEEIEAFFDYKKLLSVWQLVFEDRVLEKCVENWKHSPHIGLDNEEKLRDDLIPFDLIENKEDKIFLLHKGNGPPCLQFFWRYLSNTPGYRHRPGYSRARSAHALPPSSWPSLRSRDSGYH